MTLKVGGCLRGELLDIKLKDRDNLPEEHAPSCW